VPFETKNGRDFYDYDGFMEIYNYLVKCVSEGLHLESLEMSLLKLDLLLYLMLEMLKCM
jgi:hypothetical protein